MSREKFGDAGCNAFGVGKCEQDGVPAIVMAIHTFGEYLDFHPHLHALVADGLFDREGKFHVMRADENGGDVDAHFIGNHAALAVVVSRACDFIAAITQHIPDKRFQMARYYGWYSNKMRCHALDLIRITCRIYKRGSIRNSSALKAHRRFDRS